MLIDPVRIREVTVEEHWASRVQFNPLAPPADCGCYVLYDAGRCVYVGSAQNLRKRFYFHRNSALFQSPSLDILTGYYVACVPGYRTHLETLLIEFLKPSMNVHRRASLRKRAAC